MALKLVVVPLSGQVSQVPPRRTFCQLRLLKLVRPLLSNKLHNIRAAIRGSISHWEVQSTSHRQPRVSQAWERIPHCWMSTAKIKVACTRPTSVSSSWMWREWIDQAWVCRGSSREGTSHPTQSCRWMQQVIRVRHRASIKQWPISLDSSSICPGCQLYQERIRTWITWIEFLIEIECI